MIANRPLRRRRSAAAGPLLLAAGLMLVGPLGCFTRLVRETVIDAPAMTVMLRGEKRGGTPVEKGYAHPAQISAVRLAHILSRIDVRMNEDDAKERIHAFDAEILFDVGDALSRALARAGPSQEVVVMATRQSRRFGIFNEDRLTTFVAFVKDEQLHVKLGRIDWLLPKSGRDERPPEPYLDKQDMQFRVIPSEGMSVSGPQELSIAWRDPIFKSPTAVRVTPTGKVVRRTILMETPEDPSAAGATEEETDELPTRLAPATLRRLADLEERRQRGEVSESEYRAQRAEILRQDPSATAPEP